MRSTIEATLILTLSVVLTLLIMAVIFPQHALGGSAPALQPPSIQPAVYVYQTHDLSGTAESPSNPGAIDPATESECPYLAARGAASKCPAVPEKGATTACPFLMKKHQQELETQTPPPVKNLGQHT